MFVGRVSLTVVGDPGSAREKGASLLPVSQEWWIRWLTATVQSCIAGALLKGSDTVVSRPGGSYCIVFCSRRGVHGTHCAMFSMFVSPHSCSSRFPPERGLLLQLWCWALGSVSQGRSALLQFKRCKVMYFLVDKDSTTRGSIVEWSMKGCPFLKTYQAQSTASDPTWRPTERIKRSSAAAQDSVAAFAG